MNWIEGQGVRFENAFVLDIGAASGGFSVPFAERGARVTAVETSLPLVELLEENIAKFDEGKYLKRTYPLDKVEIQQGGRFGKVLIRLQDLSMYTRENV